jgi:hypothetical protein
MEPRDPSASAFQIAVIIGMNHQPRLTALLFKSLSHSPRPLPYFSSGLSFSVFSIKGFWTSDMLPDSWN